MRILTEYEMREIEELTINSSHIEEALRIIHISCAGTSFTDWIRISRINLSRLSDHLVYDLKRDNTLPETFDSLDQLRSYLKLQGACTTAVELARPVWKRYRRWVRGMEVRHE